MSEAVASFTVAQVGPPFASVPANDPSNTSPDFAAAVTIAAVGSRRSTFARRLHSMLC